MKFIADAGFLKDAAIMDVGGGDSKLVDALLDSGYTNITVLDISSTAIENAKKRLGKRIETITWIVTGAFDFDFSKQYDCWHDRAVFHFVTEPKKVDQYIQIMANSVKPTGSLIIGTFGENWPEKCSGLQVLRYSQGALVKILSACFHKVYCIEEIHNTPFNTSQAFTFCLLKRA